VLGMTSLVARYSLVSRVPLAKPAEVLADHAEELRQSLGFTEPVVDHASGLVYDDAYLKWAADQDSGASRWASLPAGRPAALRFWYRTSPRPLLPINKSSAVNPGDPPLQLNGMTTATLDTKGRLLRFESAPPQVETPAAAAAAAVDWKKLFTAAELDPSAFAETTPSRTPSTYADERKAWTGTLPGTKIPVRIEAAGYRGRPVLFDVVAPWATAPRDPGRGGRQGGNNPIFIYVLLGGAALAAWANVRRGRADKQGAFRLAAFTFLLLLSTGIVNAHVDDLADEQQRFFVGVGLSLFVAGALYLLYLGLEPFVRRSWPTMLVGWSRVLAGRVRDPLIGRDILVGVALGAMLAFTNIVAYILPVKLGMPEPTPSLTDLGSLLHARGFIVTILNSVNAGLQNALIGVFEFAVLRAAFEWVTHSGARWSGRRWAWAGKLAMTDKTSERVFVALVIVCAALFGIAGSGPVAPRLLTTAYQVFSITVTLFVLLRIGIFASAVMFTVNFLLLRVPLTFDGRALYATHAWFAIAGILALAAAGFWMARAGEPLFAASANRV
jgi:hypothetical protein